MKDMANRLIVSVVIPNFNGRKLLEKNLRHVLNAQENKKNHISQIIVIDDGSTDGSGELVRKRFPQIKLIQNLQNLGFARAVNRGVKTAKGDLVALLNTDVVPEENFLVAVFSHFLDKKVFAVSLHEKGYGWARGKFVNGFVEHEIGGEGDRSHKTFWVSGGSGVFRHSIWKRLGGFDERLLSPFYWEDVDLSYRALKRGYKLLWEPEAKVLHRHEATISRNYSTSYINFTQQRNQLLFIWKNIHSGRLFAQHKRGLLIRLLKHPGYLRIVLAALINFSLLKEAREKEKKETVMTDEQIFKITR